jgi:hypothetical protein
VNKDDPFDLRNLRVPPEMLVCDSIAAAKVERRRQRFVKVPLNWLEVLREARFASTLRVALFLLYRHWKDRGQPIQLSNVALTWTGVTRREKWRALAELERLGLARVIRRPRRAPLVTVAVPKHYQS